MNILRLNHVHRQGGLVFAALIFLDQFSKHLAQTHLADQVRAVHFGPLSLTYVENPNGFLGYFSHLPVELRNLYLVPGVSLLLALLAYLLWQNRWPRAIDRFSMIAIVAGGFSNLLDRLIHENGVIDFIHLAVGPLQTGIFNLADMYILVGAAVLGFRFAYKH